MKLSILDQSPIINGANAKQALNESLKLAQLGEKLGFHRYWATEHHDMSTLACSAPEVLLTYIGTLTSKIRIGAGAVLLPHYKPFKVAEVYHMLATLFPNRIDIGIGRAPGGSAEVTMALSDHFLQQVYRFKDSLEELLHFLKKDFKEDHPYANINARPLPVSEPEPWLLGTSQKSAMLAAEKGLAYTFGQFMSDEDPFTILNQYSDSFKPNLFLDKPRAMITINVICCETQKQADDRMWQMGLLNILWEKGKASNLIPTPEEAKAYRYTIDEQEKIKRLRVKTLFGSQNEVKEQLQRIYAKYPVTEIMVNTFIPDYDERRYSYELIAERGV